MRTKKQRKTHSKTPLLGRLLMLLPISCAFFYPLWLPTQLENVKTDIRSPKIPEAFHNLTIAYLSDIHYGPYFSLTRLQDLINKINALNADIIVLGGDYANDSKGALDFFSILPPLKAKTGVFAVVGNHDRTLPDSRVKDIMDAMRRAGITPLVNDVVFLRKEGAAIALCAPDDYYNGFPRLDLIKKKSSAADYIIFLPHTPDFFLDMDEYFFDLALCGHTHGGQVTLFGHALKSSSDAGDRYLSGQKHEKNADIIISNGVGTSFLPVRIGARPQYHLITLKSGDLT